MKIRNKSKLKQILRNEYEAIAEPLADQDAIAASREPDEFEEIDRQSNVAMTLAAIENRWRKRKEISLALDRLANCEYGRCLEGDEEIGEKRLEALPWALLCRDCQEQRESASSA